MASPRSEIQKRFARQGSDGLRSARDGDFEEQDVWDVLGDRQYHHFNAKIIQQTKPSVSARRFIPSASRIILGTVPAGHSSRNSGSFGPHEEKGVIIEQQSAPLNIPHWAKHHSKKQKPNASHHDGDGDDDDDDHRDSDNEHDDDDENDSDYKLAPHEFVARRLAKTQISSFSVFEGVGRKLKGRDLSTVRNAVLTKTGFLE